MADVIRGTQAVLGSDLNVCYLEVGEAVVPVYEGVFVGTQRIEKWSTGIIGPCPKSVTAGTTTKGGITRRNLKSRN